MLEKLKKIRIKGNSYFEDNIIDLFDNNKERYLFIYGNNGSGKSTISKAFGFLKNSYNEDFEEVQLLDENNNLISLPPEELDKIHIFNEDFVDNYVKIQSDGMSAIVMFGEQVKIDEQIKELEEKLSKEKVLFENCKNKQDEYGNENSLSSPYHYHKILENRIKNIWLSNDMKARKLSKKSPYTEKIFENIRNTKYKKDIKLEEEKLEKNIDFINNVDDNQTIYDKVDLNFKLGLNYETEIQNLLSKKIEKPILTEREKKIFDIFVSSHSSIIYDSKDYFTTTKLNYCPFCFQEVTREYKECLMDNIIKVLSDEVELYKEELNGKKLLEIDTLNLNSYSELDNKMINDINLYIKEYNDEVININTIIDLKIKNVYNDIQIDKIQIQKCYNNVIKAINNLNEIIDLYNTKVKNLKNLQEECKELNTIITRNKLNSDFELYNKYLTEMEVNKENITKSEKEISVLKKEISNLNAQKKNYTIAMKEINSDLKHIFFDNKRLYLEHEDGKYVVKSRGKKVSPKKVSIGERNAIALSYYFNVIKSNTDKKSCYKNDFSLIIDDPISSFDNDNKIGVYSFLRSKINEIMIRNINNKAIIMTHSIEAMYNFGAYQNDYGTDFKKMFVYKELRDKQTTEFTKSNNIYNTAFLKAFDYANEVEKSSKFEIGNVVRKVLESFSTFEYRCGFYELSRKKAILEKIPIELQGYYENLMYRLFLNGDSHFVNLTYSMIDTDFILNQDESDRIDIIRSLFVLIYLIDNVHVEGQLQNNNQLKIIEAWKNDLINKLK